MSGVYDGPGEYTVSVSFTGSSRVTVTAMNRDEAIGKAIEEADAPFDFDADDADILSVQPMAGEDMETDWRDKLTGVEEAYWAITGHVPEGAFARIRAEQQAEVQR